jgi:hypothetical protein
LAQLQQHVFDLMTPWLSRYRATLGRKAKTGDLGTALMAIELPRDTEVVKRRQWVDLLQARTRPNEEPARALSPEARRAIEQRKREYQARRKDLEELIISQPGTSLGRTSERLVVRREGKRVSETPFPMLRNVTLLTTAVSISGELIAQMAARGIAIHLLGHDGKPVARIGPPEAVSYHLSMAQAKLADSHAGLDLARSLVLGKIGNQVNLLRYFAKYPGRRQGEQFVTECNKAILAMEELRKDLAERKYEAGCDHELLRARLFAAEGQAAGGY